MEIKVKIEGISPLLMHRFTEADQLAMNKSRSALKTGSKRLPREQAASYLYTNANEHPVLPSTNFLACLVDAGRFIKVGTRSVSTLKSSLVPAGIEIEESEAPIDPNRWEVDSRPVVNPSTGNRAIAHRPRFDEWACEFTLAADEDLFGPELVRELVDIGGRRVGLCDHRPSRRGPFGKFVVSHWET
jgi:hypothetical protein